MTHPITNPGALLVRLGALGALSTLALTACAAEPAALETSMVSSAIQTIHDVDIAVECEGILTYVHWASYAELDAYLPVNVVDGIVARRAVSPFVSLEDLSSVSGIAQGRLEQIAGRARAIDFIDQDCAGVYEELAVSYDDRARILQFVNTATHDQLWDVARTEPDTVAPQLIARRPHTTLQHVVDTYGVGPSTFRSIRDAAITDPFDELVGRVHAAPSSETEIKTAFNWYSAASHPGGYHSSMVCFGVPAQLVIDNGGQLRPNLATASEVYDEVAGAVSWANRFGGVGSATAGLAHLQAQLTGHQFFGCYVSYQPNPWCGVNRAFFVNKDTGHRVLTEIQWCE